jgi:hypothetical protein
MPGRTVDEIGQKNGIVREPALIVPELEAITHQKVLVPHGNMGCCVGDIQIGKRGLFYHRQNPVHLSERIRTKMLIEIDAMGDSRMGRDLL